MKHLRPVLVLLVSVAFVGSLAACGDKDEVTSVSESTEPQSEKEPAPATFRVGEVVEADEWTVIVHAVQDPVEVDPDGPFAPDQGFRRVVIDTEVTNNAAEEKYVSATCFDLKDGEDRRFEMAGVGDIGGDLAAGESRRAELSYDVPEDATDLVLYFQCDLALRTPWVGIALS